MSNDRKIYISMHHMMHQVMYMKMEKKDVKKDWEFEYLAIPKLFAPYRPISF